MIDYNKFKKDLQVTKDKFTYNNDGVTICANFNSDVNLTEEELRYIYIFCVNSFLQLVWNQDI